MFRNMVTSLFKYEKIQTTGAKAKELRRWADHLITLAKRGDLHARRQALSIIREKKVVHKLFNDAQKRFGGSAGGYTRIIKIGRRPGDSAPVSMIELVTFDAEKAKKKTPSKADSAPKEAFEPDRKAEASPTEPDEQTQDGPGIADSPEAAEATQAEEVKAVDPVTDADKEAASSETKPEDVKEATQDEEYAKGE
jgi:large subunit ribosomal protein L17